MKRKIIHLQVVYMAHTQLHLERMQNGMISRALTLRYFSTSFQPISSLSFAWIFWFLLLQRTTTMFKPRLELTTPKKSRICSKEWKNSYHSCQNFWRRNLLNKISNTSSISQRRMLMRTIIPILHNGKVSKEKWRTKSKILLKISTEIILISKWKLPVSVTNLKINSKRQWFRMIWNSKLKMSFHYTKRISMIKSPDWIIKRRSIEKLISNTSQISLNFSNRRMNFSRWRRTRMKELFRLNPKTKLRMKTSRIYLMSKNDDWYFNKVFKELKL